MMSAEVTGSSVWGEGPGRYAVYKIDINYKGDSYAIYRRYQAFFDLNQMLLNSNPVKMSPLQSLFPDKGNMGSLVNSFDSVVADRIQAWRRYLPALLRLEGILTQDVVQRFFDTGGKGISGFRKSIGSNHILKETYLEFSWSTFEFVGLYLWSTHFVGLTKRGHLSVFSTLYDELNDAVVTIDLRTIDVRVTGDVSTLIIGILNPQIKIYLKFQSVGEFSSWLRQISDFGVNAASNNTPSVAADRLQAQNTRSGPAVSSSGPVARTGQPQQHLRNDEFSDMYGM